MVATMVGNVYYLDDPQRNIFRRVWALNDDTELDDPKWVNLGCDPSRIAVMIKVPKDSADATSPMTGLP